MLSLVHLAVRRQPDLAGNLVGWVRCINHCRILQWTSIFQFRCLSPRPIQVPAIRLRHEPHEAVGLRPDAAVCLPGQ